MLFRSVLVRKNRAGDAVPREGLVGSETMPAVFAEMGMEHSRRYGTTLEQFATVSVKNQGPGLTEEQMSRLFTPFTHIQTPDAPGSQGSGVGLAFCHQMIRRHRGTIRAESPVGEGVLVTFSLPVANATLCELPIPRMGMSMIVSAILSRFSLTPWRSWPTIRLVGRL